MKRIVFLVNDIHFNGGGERVVTNMASHFSQEGNEVTILSMAEKKEIAIFHIDNKVRIEYLGIKNSKICSKYKVYANLKSYIYNHQDRIYFGIGTYANVLLGFFQSKFRNIKSIGCEHNSFTSVSYVWNILRKLTYRNLSHCVVLTNTDLKPMMKLNPNSHVIPNSINTFGIQSSLISQKFIAIGRLSDQKNFSELIYIFKDFCMINKDWTLDIYGEGEQHDYLIQLINKLKLNKYVRILPFTMDIMNVYKNSSCLLMTSKYEGLPMVLIEAQDCGLPIISYDCDTGPRDIISEGINGYLIPTGNRTAFVNAMNSIVNSFQLRKQLGDAAKVSSLNFYPAAIYSKWNDILNIL